MGLKVQTVFTVLRNFKVDYNLKKLTAKIIRPDKRRKEIISNQFENFLLNNDTL